MRTTFISTQSLLNTPRNGVSRMQAEVTRLSKEITTGRIDDVGLAFGAATGHSVTLHVDLDSLGSTIDSLKTATTRLSQTQLSLDQMRGDASSFLDQMIATPATADTASGVMKAAQQALAAFTSNVNASDGHNYLFAGINSSVAPMPAYDAGPKAAVDAAFLAKFGFPADDPQVATISATDMADFLDNEFSDLFADPQWGTTWSSASDKTIATRVSGNETLDTSVSANTQAMRKLAMVYTMVGELGFDRLGSDARQVITDRARSTTGTAVSDLVDVQAGVGTSQNRLKESTDRLTLQQQITQQRLQTLEGVDAAEAKVKVDTLSTEIEMSYSLTAKLLQISLLNYV